MLVGAVLGVSGHLADNASRHAGWESAMDRGKTNLTAGSAQSNPYQRAFVAIHGLFALNQSEAIYYTATADNDGRRARRSIAAMRSAGRDPDARWWSITAYRPTTF